MRSLLLRWAQILRPGGPELPLDTLAASLVVAYGMRRLVSTWTGPLVTARRSTDNATMNVYAGGDGWLDTTALLAWAGSASAYVTRWWDQSGRGWHAEQATATAQAMIVNAGVIISGYNGRPALKFDGISHRFLVANSSSFSQNVPEITLASVISVAGDNSTVTEQNIIHCTTPSGLARAKLITFTGATSHTSGGRRLDTDSFASIASTSISVNTWFRSVNNLRAVDARIDRLVNGVITSASWQTAGNFSNTAQLNGVTIGGVNTGTNLFCGMMSTAILANKAININTLDAALLQAMT